MACIDAHAHLALRAGAADRLLESMDRHPADELLKIDNLPLPAAEVAMIRGGNAATLLARGHHVC